MTSMTTAPSRESAVRQLGRRTKACLNRVRGTEARAALNFARDRQTRQRLRPSNGTRFTAESSTSSRHLTFTAAAGAPDESVPNPNGAQPHTGQK
jgi:hypothetical protein